MQTIGEKLEEARKRKGISLREAAEATKIRSDFLGNIEKNIYDYDLPQIYKNGFIVNYAKYLKLNHSKILTQYQEQLIANTKRSKKASTELFGGNIDLKKPAEDSLLNEQKERPSYGRINVKNDSEAQAEKAGSAENAPSDSNKELYIKTGIVGFCTLLFVFSAIWLIQSIVNSDSPAEVQTETRIQATELSESQNPLRVTNDAPIQEISLKASDSVYVVVMQKADSKMLLKKTLNAGEIQRIKSKGPAVVVCPMGENLSYITDGLTEPVQLDEGKQILIIE
jgi:cytoskeletal protein RodZ